MAPGHRADGLLRGGVSIMFSRMAGTSVMLWVERRVAGAALGWGCVAAVLDVDSCASCLRACGRSCPPPVLHGVVELITAHDAVRVWKVGDTEVKNDRQCAVKSVGANPRASLSNLRHRRQDGWTSTPGLAGERLLKQTPRACPGGPLTDGALVKMRLVPDKEIEGMFLA